MGYGVFWSNTTRTAQQSRLFDINATALTVDSMSWPSLKGMVRWFSQKKYSSYMIGRQWLLPLSNEYWHDAYEVCRAPHSLLYRGLHSLFNGWCWLDVLFLDEGSPLELAV